MFSGNNVEVIATLILIAIHLLQVLYMRRQVLKADEATGRLEAADERSERHFNILRDGVLLGASSLVYAAGVLLVTSACGPLGVGVASYYAITWRPLDIEYY